MEMCTPGGGCELCGDVAHPLTVLRIDDASGTAVALLNGQEVAVALDLVDDVRAGDVVLVHQGFAIERVAP